MEMMMMMMMIKTTTTTTTTNTELSGIVLGYGQDDRWFDSRQGLEIFFTIASREALGPTQPPIQRLPGTLSLGVKQPGREADHSPPPSAEVNAWSRTFTPPIRFYGVVLS
jgi:hypothetical protein